MVRVCVYASGSPAPLADGPSFRFALGTLARGDTAEPIGTYRHHGWMFDQRFHTRIALKDRVRAYFEDDDRESQTYGPFAAFEIIVSPNR